MTLRQDKGAITLLEQRCSHLVLFHIGRCAPFLVLFHLHCARTWILGSDLSKSHHQVQPDMSLTKCLSSHTPTPFCCVRMSDGVPEPQGKALAFSNKL